MEKSSTTVLVTTAIALTPEQRKKITSAVKKSHKADSVELIETVDPEVIGGIRLTIGSQDYDSTVASKLKKIKYQLLEKI